VLIQAPLTPRASNTSGPTQQTDAPIAASIPPTRNPFPLRVDCFGSDISSETDLTLRTIVRNQEEIECAEIDYRQGGGSCRSQRRDDPLLSATRTSGRAQEASRRIPQLSHGNGERIRFIKRAQALGFTLEDVAGLLQLNNTDACAQTRDLGAQKLALIEQKLSALATMRDALSKLVGQCDKQLKSGTCPIIEVLQWDSRPEQSAKESSNLRNPNRKTVFAPSLESQTSADTKRNLKYLKQRKWKTAKDTRLPLAA
jgi:hypothetical protein